MIYPITTIDNIITACWLVFMLYWLVNAFTNKKDIYKRRNLWLRIVMMFVVILVIQNFHNNYITQIILPYTKFTQILGVVVCALGVGYAIWARTILSTNWSSFPTVKENHELVQTGPYAITRHPIYTGILAAYLGTFLAIIPTWIGLVLFICAIVWLVWRIRKEEKLMTQTFPDKYPAYKQRVKYALIPLVF